MKKIIVTLFSVMLVFSFSTVVLAANNVTHQNKITKQIVLSEEEPAPAPTPAPEPVPEPAPAPEPEPK